MACGAPDSSIPEAVHIPFSSYLYTFRHMKMPERYTFRHIKPKFRCLFRDSLRLFNRGKQFLQKTKINQTPVAFICAKNGDGLNELFEKMSKILTSGLSTEREQAGLGSARQKESVQEALNCSKHALVSADDNYTLDAVVQDLEDALDALGEVTGDVTPDDVLGSIFANFCVGK